MSGHLPKRRPGPAARSGAGAMGPRLRGAADGANPRKEEFLAPPWGAGGPRMGVPDEVAYAVGTTFCVVPARRCVAGEGTDRRRRENAYVNSSHRASPPKMPPENEPSRATRAMATFVGLGIIG